MTRSESLLAFKNVLTEAQKRCINERLQRCLWQFLSLL